MKEFHSPIPHTLLEIARRFPDRGEKPRNLHNPALRPLFKELRGYLPSHHLSEEEMAVIAILFAQFIERHKRMDARDIAERLYPDHVERLRVFQVIRKLVVKGLLDIRGVRVRDMEPSDRPEDRYSLVRLVESEVLFREVFLQSIIGEKPSRQRLEDTPFRDNRDYLEGWFTYIKAIQQYRNTQSLDPDCDNSSEDAALRDAKAMLDKRLALTTERFPLQNLIDEEGLDERERDIMLYLLKEEIADAPCTVSELVEFISADRFEQFRNRCYFDPHSKLVSRGIVEVMQDSFFLMKRSELRLAPDVSRRLLTHEPGDDRQRIDLILRGQDLLELMTPRQAMDDLIVPTQLREKLDTAVKRYRSAADKRLREWGIDVGRPDARVCDRDEAPLLLLFSGPSGTGKTFAAGAFARQLGKELLVTDVSRVLSCYVGESEQNVRRLFYLFDRVVRRMDNPPVLLLNECDQFLSTRGGGKGSSADRMYHQMQNLFLEAFERVRGIVIATTNLADTIDSAFSRRFHLKLEFPLPDYEGRCALWCVHLPKSLPRAKDVSVEQLARDYEFSGGQIALVVRNAAISAAVRGGKVNMFDLLQASESEVLGAHRLAGRYKKIGFIN